MEITLNLPENINRNFSETAEKNHRRVGEVVADKLQVDGSSETEDYAKTVAGWTDEDVLALANLKLPKEQFKRMSELAEKFNAERSARSRKTNGKFIWKSTTTLISDKAHGIVGAVKR